MIVEFNGRDPRGGRISRAAFDFPGGRRFRFTDQGGYALAVWSAVA